MSMVICDSCTALIDSDEDCDCFVYGVGSVPSVYCEHCREARDDVE